MELMVGGVYRFDRTGEFYVVKVTKDKDWGYGVDILEAIGKNVTRNGGEIGTIHKGGSMMKNYTITVISEPVDKSSIPDGALIDLYIDMALQTKDKKWFDQLMQIKQEVSA